MSSPPASAQAPPSVEWSAGRLSVSAVDAPLADVLREVARRSGAEVEGLAALHDDRISARFEGLTLKEALEQLLSRTDYVLAGDPDGAPGGARVRVIVLESRPGPRADRAEQAVEDEHPADTAPEEDEAGSEIEAPDDEAVPDVDVVGEDASEGAAFEEPPATVDEGAIASALPDAPGSAPELAADAEALGAAVPPGGGEAAVIEETGTAIAVPDSEPEPDVKIIGEDGPD